MEPDGIEAGDVSIVDQPFEGFQDPDESVSTSHVPVVANMAQKTRDHSSRKAGSRAVVKRSLWPHLPILILVFAYFWRFAWLSVDSLRGYGQSAFDLGTAEQGIWLLSRFHDPFVTVMGRNFFGDHTSFIFVLLVPLYWIYPHTAALLTIQAGALAAAGIPIYLLGLHLVRKVWVATVLAAAYLLNPAIEQGNLTQFHVEAFEVLFLATAIYAAVVWRPRLLLVVIVLLLLCKQDTAMYAIPLGVWVMARRDRKLGSVIIAISVAAALLMNYLVIPILAGTSTYALYSDRLPYGGLLSSLDEIARYPGQVWLYLTSQGRPFYFWQMIFSAGLAFFLAPEVALIAIVGLGVNIWTNFGYQHQIIYQYSMPIVPILICGTIWAISRTVGRRQAVLAVLAAGFALWSCVMWGLAPFSNEQYPYANPSSVSVQQINQVINAVPPNADVAAYYQWVPSLDKRTNIYDWPNPFYELDWGYVPTSGEVLPEAKKVQYIVLPVPIGTNDAAVWNKISSQFHVVKENTSAVLYERN